MTRRPRRRRCQRPSAQREPERPREAKHVPAAKPYALTWREVAERYRDPDGRRLSEPRVHQIGEAAIRKLRAAVMTGGAA